jgi:hypothetical protein
MKLPILPPKGPTGQRHVKSATWKKVRPVFFPEKPATAHIPSAPPWKDMPPLPDLEQQQRVVWQGREVIEQT